MKNLEWYRYFYTVARTGGFTQASRELFVSQPAVSHCILQLERSLGCALFERVPKGTRLTKEGETLFAYIEAAFNSVAEGEKKLYELSVLDGGEIRIGASDMTLRYYLLPHLERFHAVYPKIKIIVTNAPTPDTLDMLSKDKIDFGVISEPLPTGIDAKRVQEIEDIFVCGRRFYTEETLTLEEVARLPMICLESNTSTRSYVDSFFRSNGVTLSPEFELATSDLIVSFAERELGVGCVVRDFARDSLASGKLFELKTVKKMPPRGICVVRGTSVSNAGSKLIEMLF